MASMVQKVLLLCLLISINSPAQATFWEDLMREEAPLVLAGVAVVSAVVAGTAGALLGGKNCEAKTIQQMRLSEIQKRDLEDKDRRAVAEQKLYEILKRYEVDFANGASQNELPKEKIEKASLRYANQTPFYHLHFTHVLSQDIETLYSIKRHLTKEECRAMEQMAQCLQRIQEVTHAYFKDDMATEIVEKKQAEAQQQFLDYQVAAKREKYAAKKIKTEALQESAATLRAVNNGCATALNNVQQALNKFVEQEHSIYSAHLAERAALLQTIKYELGERGYYEVAHKLEKLIKIVNNMAQRDHEHFDKNLVLERLDSIAVSAVAMNQELLKNNNAIQALKKQHESENQALKKKIEALEMSLAQIAADLSDKK